MKAAANDHHDRLHAPLAGFVLLAALAAPALQAATVLTVGSAPSCTYPSLRAALAAAATQPGGTVELRVALADDSSLNYGNGGEVAIANPTADIHVIGGYASCSAGTPTPGQRTTITKLADATNGPHTLLTLYNDPAAPRRAVTLEHLVFLGPNDPLLARPTFGGALRVSDNIDVLLQDSGIVGFGAQLGGGIAVTSSASSSRDKFARLVLADSGVMSNTAQSGGGIYANNGRVVMRDADVAQNFASNMGGGIFLYDVNVAGSIGDPLNVALLLDNVAGGNTILSNRAVDQGGGIASINAQVLAQGKAGDRNLQTGIGGNTAAEGAGLYVRGDADAYTEVTLRDIAFNDNAATVRGGAIFLEDAVHAQIEPGVAESCRMGTTVTQIPCAQFFDNAVNPPSGAVPLEPRGGAIYLDRARAGVRPILYVSGALFDGNRDPRGNAAVAAARNGAELVVQRSIFVRNDARHDAVDSASALIWSETKPVIFRYNTVLDSNTSTRMFRLKGGSIDVSGSILWGTLDRTLPFHFVWFAENGATMSHNDCVMVRGNDDGTVDVPAPAAGYAYAYGTNIPPSLDASYAPTSWSPALDYCDEYAVVPPPDAYGNDRQDVPDIANVFSAVGRGGWDLGAVEQTDIIYANGFGIRPAH